MAIKTFTTGEVLTAADTNTYLANSGLTYIESFTLTSTTGELQWGTFSSTYRNYRIVIDNLITTNQGVLNAYLGTTAVAAGYYSSAIYDQASGGLTGAVRTNNTGTWAIGLTEVSPIGSSYTFDLCNPQTAVRASFMGTYNGRVIYAGYCAGGHDNTAQFTTMNFNCPGGSLVSGNFTLYGYRKP
jgi:hypothetical protein